MATGPGRQPARVSDEQDGMKQGSHKGCPYAMPAMNELNRKVNAAILRRTMTGFD